MSTNYAMPTVAPRRDYGFAYLGIPLIGNNDIVFTILSLEALDGVRLIGAVHLVARHHIDLPVCALIKLIDEMQLAFGIKILSEKI